MRNIAAAQHRRQWGVGVDAGSAKPHPIGVLDVLTVVVLLFVGSRLLGGTRLLGRSDVRDHVLVIVRGLRWRHFLWCWPVIIAVIIVATLTLAVPGLSWGWWSAIGGVGNPVLGVSGRSSGSPLEWVIPTLFVAMLVPALPLFAESEERRFRAGAEYWSTASRVRRAVAFGLVHCVIGIPIGVGLALSIGGLYFTWAYLRGYERSGGSRQAAISESTRAHLAYNVTILAVVGLALVFGL